MKVILYPADDYGCGHHRLIWPAECLRASGHDVSVVATKDRHVRISLEGDRCTNVDVPSGVDVIVFQRPTDRRLVAAIHWLRDAGRTVVVDVDDDLGCIHPQNPAFTFLDPNRAKHEVQDAMRARKIDARHAAMAVQSLEQQYTHSWNNLMSACRVASLVTLSTPGLLRRYGRTGRQALLRNYLADHYYEHEHEDSDLIAWPAALHSHPNDPAACGNAIVRTVQDGGRFVGIGSGEDLRQAFGLREPVEVWPSVDLLEWPQTIARAGIGIAPLADTKFNASKSWLKPLELAALGVPVVMSPRSEYGKLARMGVGLVADDPRRWYRALTDLRHSASLRQELGAAGRAAAEDLRLRDHAYKWWEAWAQALAVDRGVSADSVVS